MRVLEQVQAPEQARVQERVQAPVQERVLGQAPVQGRVQEQEQVLAQEPGPEQVPGSVSFAATTQLPWNWVTGHGRSTSRLTTLAFQRFPVRISSTRTRSMTVKTRSKTRSSSG